ncbi:hypothetical protein LguiA_033841 [Lonicera macranthoides]
MRQLNLRRASLKARPDLVSGISKDSHGGSGGSSTSQNNGREGHDDTSGGGSSQNDRREDTDDVPVEHGENSKSPSTENQPPLAPENIDSKVKTPRALFSTLIVLPKLEPCQDLKESFLCLAQMEKCKDTENWTEFREEAEQV